MQYFQNYELNFVTKFIYEYLNMTGTPCVFLAIVNKIYFKLCQFWW